MNQPEFSFMASLHSLSEADHTAKFYIMNTSCNRNKWGVSEKALGEALPTLKKAKLGIGPNYQIDKHYKDAEVLGVGSFTDFEQPQANYALATAKVTDPNAFNMMKKGTLGPVSVVIHAYDVVCSNCKAALSAEDPSEHSCIKSGAGYEQVNSFVFHRVDFVDVPAYPQAGCLSMSAAASRTLPLELCANFYESQQTKFDKIVEEIRTDIEYYHARQEEELQSKITEMRANLGFEPLKEQPSKPTSELCYSSRYSVADAIEKTRRELGLASLEEVK